MTDIATTDGSFREEAGKVHQGDSTTTASPPPPSSAYPGQSASAPALGPLVRLRPLKPSELPAHPELASLQTSGNSPDLQTFVNDVLNEASSFMTDYLPSSFTVKSESKPSPPSTAQVQLLSHDVLLSKIPKEARTGSDESWFARTSLHKNVRESGTADWAEFEEGLLDDHSQHEMDYTPDVFDAHKVLTWDLELGQVDAWEKVGMSIYEMAHHIPPPLNNRVFSVVVLTARKTAISPSFLVVQIPVDISKVDHALYSNGKHKTSGDTSQKKKDITLGQYVSIERAELVKDGPEVRWQMATASDAKGNLPMWVQKMGTAPAIVKDVGMFIGWAQKRRK